mmetsp:Transcript_66464/g.188683  ORF Transcript_66464/g.188683 Transcript_66464/m.188683 type:complete len:107 (-) Transcript_66464:1456-1776(-)
MEAAHALEKHEETYKKWFAGRMPTGGEESCPSWEAYVAALRKNNAWGSDLEALAIVGRYAMPILLWQEDTGTMSVYNRAGKIETDCDQVSQAPLYVAHGQRGCQDG